MPRVTFKALLHRYGAKGEKTGWTYINIPPECAEAMKPGMRKSFRVNGLLDAHPIQSAALMPNGDGTFFLAINATMRKAIRKEEGAEVAVALEPDDALFTIPPELAEALDDDPAAKENFFAMTPGTQRYYANWLHGVKSPELRMERLVHCVMALGKGLSFGEMVRAMRSN